MALDSSTLSGKFPTQSSSMKTGRVSSSLNSLGLTTSWRATGATGAPQRRKRTAPFWRPSLQPPVSQSLRPPLSSAIGAAYANRVAPILGGSVPLLGGSVPILGGSVPILGGSVPLHGGVASIFGGVSRRAPHYAGGALAAAHAVAHGTPGRPRGARCGGRRASVGVAAACRAALVGSLRPGSTSWLPAPRQH